MKMYAMRLIKEFLENTTCEYCGKIEGTWAVVPKEEIEELQKNAEMSKTEAATFLLEESETGTQAAGEILCTGCLEKRIGHPIPRKKWSQAAHEKNTAGII